MARTRTPPTRRSTAHDDAPDAFTAIVDRITTRLQGRTLSPELRARARAAVIEEWEERVAIRHHLGGMSEADAMREAMGDAEQVLAARAEAWGGQRRLF